MPHHGRFRAIIANVSHSPFSEDLLEYEFSRSLWFQPSIATPTRVIQFNTSVSIRISWWFILEMTSSYAESSPLGWREYPPTGSTPSRHAQSTASDISPDYFSLITPPVRSSSRTTITSFSSKWGPLTALKYISYFQNQLTKVHNCSEDTSALMFISGLRVTHPLYMHLVKYNVTRWSEVLYWAQLYMQLEEAMKGSTNLSFHHSDDEIKPKLPHRV